MMEDTLGYLGPAGTFTEEAALKYFNGKEEITLKEYAAIDQVVEAIGKKEIGSGLVPLENSLEGSVNLTLDLLAEYRDIYINREIIYSISHCLLASNGVDFATIEELYSHPQVFSQCRGFISEKMPEVKKIPCYSTAAAAALVSGENNKAAVASRRAAELSGLKVLASNLEDNNDNRTRFVVISTRDHSCTGADKTSLVISIKDGPGSLYNVLGVFARRNINLTRIESRPARKNLGDYLFFIDFEGHREESWAGEALEELKQHVVYCKMLGSYPQGKLIS